jgi:predicted nucleotidyltransferase
MGMKTVLDHLPEKKQQELQRVIEITREEIDLEMLILFGSYARGDWIERKTILRLYGHPSQG